jgi:Flp pilus assembly protein TadG
MALELFAFLRRSKGTRSRRGAHARLASAPFRGPRPIVQLLGDKSGASAIIIGLTSMVLLGFTALGTEASYWYFTHRNLQNAADSAAMSAVAALQNIPSSPDAAHRTSATAEAKATAGRYGFVDAQGGVAVAVNIPPTAGAYTSQANAVEVVITEPQTLFLTAAMKFGGTPLFAAKPTQKVRAVAHPGTNGNGCVVTLDRGTISDLFTNGNTVLNLTGCDLYVNSNAAAALDQVGNATINARAAFVTGGISSTANASLFTTAGNFTGTAPINDPYAGLAPPYTSPGSGCTNATPPTTTHVNITTSGSTTTYTPDGTNMAIFCGGWSPSGTVFLKPGLYVVDGGTFGCNGCTISGDNVTIFLTGSGTNYATLSFSGTSSTQLNINAPTAAYVSANPTKAIMGIAIYSDRNAPTTSASAFSGQATATINGVIYMPTQNVTFNGNATGASPTCSQIISFTLVFHGNSGFQNNCAVYSNPATGEGVVSIGAIPAQLVE